MAQTDSVHPGKTEPEKMTAVGLGADLGEDVETGTEVSENDETDDSVIEDASELGESDDVVDVAITDDDEDD
jgi:hypothetical protein